MEQVSEFPSQQIRLKESELRFAQTYGLTRRELELMRHIGQALSNQQLVLDQITALNTTTSGLIERTSEMLKDNSIRIQEQAASATIGLPQLQRAFQNIYATMDAIDTFKVQALDNMAATIGTLETEVAKSRSYLDRVQRQDQRIVSGSLDLGRPNA